MKLLTKNRVWLLLLAGCLLPLAAPVPAGVPQPMFFFYGEARDAFGWPFQNGAGATVVAYATTLLSKAVLPPALMQSLVLPACLRVWRRWW